MTNCSTRQRNTGLSIKWGEVSLIPSFGENKRVILNCSLFHGGRLKCTIHQTGWKSDVIFYMWQRTFSTENFRRNNNWPPPRQNWMKGKWHEPFKVIFVLTRGLSWGCQRSREDILVRSSHIKTNVSTDFLNSKL